MINLKQKITMFTAVILALIAPTYALAAQASQPPAMAAPTGLSILELKITGDEFVMLINNTTTSISLSNYWLTSYNNVSPLGNGVSNTSQQLPEASLMPNQTLLLSANPMQTCGASVAGKLSVGLTDGGGFLQLSNMSLATNGAVMQMAGDYVNWHSSTNGVIQNVPSSTKAPKAMYYRYSAGSSFAWQQADFVTADSCQLNIVVAGGSGSSSAVTPLNLVATSPPATIMGTAETTNENGSAIPGVNMGLSAPQMSELLPNPVGTGNDATDEFIELYNPNTQPFDLSGYVLRTGLKTYKTYEFPQGTILQPSAFKAFSAVDTRLSLSNTSSQVSLIDPLGNIISSSDVYTNAKDGIGWVNAGGKWQWTTKLTPGARNIVQLPPVKKSKPTTKKNIKSTSRGASSAVHAKEVSSGKVSSEEQAADVVHYRVLALVGGVALLYGAYEYRHDMANQLRQFRGKLSARRTNRAAAGGAGSD